MEPVLEVEPGSIVTLETNDCFTGQIQTEADLVTEIDFQRVNSATGPIAVRGAEPGDSLVVELLEVKPVERGFATLIPGIGQLIDKVRSPVTQVFEVEGDTIRMNERVSFPTRPMMAWSSRRIVVKRPKPSTSQRSIIRCTESAVSAFVSVRPSPT